MTRSEFTQSLLNKGNYRNYDLSLKNGNVLKIRTLDVNEFSVELDTKSHHIYPVVIYIFDEQGQLVKTRLKGLPYAYVWYLSIPVVLILLTSNLKIEKFLITIFVISCCAFVALFQYTGYYLVKRSVDKFIGKSNAEKV